MEISKISKNKKKEIPYISVKACPVCGEHPELKKETLERGRGCGYPGCYDYEYQCGYCQLLKGGTTHDIYVSSEEAINLAKKAWNEEVDRIERIIEQRFRD
jgi:hypothetical protein